MKKGAVPREFETVCPFTWRLLLRVFVVYPKFSWWKKLRFRLASPLTSDHSPALLMNCLSSCLTSVAFVTLSGCAVAILLVLEVRFV